MTDDTETPQGEKNIRVNSGQTTTPSSGGPSSLHNNGPMHSGPNNFTVNGRRVGPQFDKQWKFEQRDKAIAARAKAKADETAKQQADAEASAQQIAQQHAQAAAQQLALQEAKAAATQKAASDALLEAEKVRTDIETSTQAKFVAMLAPPGLITATSGAVTSPKAAINLAREHVIRAALTTLSRNLPLALALYSPKLANSEASPSVVGTPLTQLNLPETTDLGYIASVRGTVSVENRLVTDATTANAPAQ